MLKFVQTVYKELTHLKRQQSIPLGHHTVNRDPKFGFLHSELFLYCAKYFANRTENS